MLETDGVEAIVLPMERFGKTAGHEEPDKVPIFLFMTLHGSKILDMTPQEYFSKGENVAKGQMKLQEVYKHDNYYPFFYAAKEYEAFGGTPLYKTYGSPESGKPLFESADALLSSELPSPQHEAFNPIVTAQKILHEAKGSEIPIINSVIAPFSLPVMLLGFETWIECIVDQPSIAKEVTNHLVSYTIDLSNHLFDNGSTALAYFNPVSSGTVIRIDEYLDLCVEADSKYYRSIKGPAVFALAGGTVTQLLPTLRDTVKPPGVVVSRKDDLQSIKAKFGKDFILLGNMDNIQMTHWSEKDAENEVKRCIEEGSDGGGFILTEHHGEIPIQVEEKIIQKLVDSRDRWGRYS